MDLMEYKAKELFSAGGLPVQKFAHIGEEALARGDAELIRAAADSGCRQSAGNDRRPRQSRRHQICRE